MKFSMNITPLEATPNSYACLSFLRVSKANKKDGLASEIGGKLAKLMAGF
jgi:hypothetical protein